MMKKSIMSKMKKMKVTRHKMPETNSSSSHSVSISSGDSDNWVAMNDPRVFNFPLDEDGNIVIEPTKDHFGWEVERYNDVVTKALYVFATQYDYDGKPHNPKMIKKIKSIISRFTGRNVILSWDDALLEKIKLNEECPDAYEDPGIPEIDHNSHDIFSEILESSQTIKDFIFSPNSWLFLGNDNGGDPDDLYQVPRYTNNCGVLVETLSKDDTGVVVSIELPEPVGRVDITRSSDHIYLDDGIRDELRMFKVSSAGVIEVDSEYYSWSINNTDDYLRCQGFMIDNIGNYFAYFLTNDSMNLIYERLSETPDESTSLYDSIHDKSEVDRIIKELSLNMLVYPVSIKFKEFYETD